MVLLSSMAAAKVVLFAGGVTVRVGFGGFDIHGGFDVMTLPGEGST